MIKVIKHLKQLPARWNNKELEAEINHFKQLVEKIKEVNLENEEDSKLVEMSKRLVSLAQRGISEDELLVQSFSLVKEAAKRKLGIEPFDVQILAGIAMHKGKLAQMQTGEGKTLAAVFPAYLNALTGKGVHIFTANDYLAKRDAGWMGPVFAFLGIRSGFINEGMSREDRKKAYAADITYVTAKEAGFDYLRDSLCYEDDELTQKGFGTAIVDEADFILIDEARIPLVIAENEPVKKSISDKISKIVDVLVLGADYNTDESFRNVYLTDNGTDKLEELLECGNLYSEENYELLLEINCALHARALLRRDVDYIVKDGKLKLVDGFTGRIADKRVWPDGLQAAIESKEGLSSFQEGRILSTITMQHFIKSYAKICGMTATAAASSAEFKEFYDLDVVVIPPNKPCKRIDHEDILFAGNSAKFHAIISEIKSVHASGRPILIGTASIEESQRLSDALREDGIYCNVLNAKNHEQEAEIIAQAGCIGAVTVSTNMAGRGTDIRLGGADEAERDKVVALGGLYVIGTNKHESRRIDSQLRGRSGRQGDPGSSRFFISLEDELIKKYGSKSLNAAAIYLKGQKGPIDDAFHKRLVEKAQRAAEGQNEDMRFLLWRYSNIIENQRKIFYNWRQAVLRGASEFVKWTFEALKEYNNAQKYVSIDVLMKIEKYIMLFHMDRLWAEYIYQTNYIREGIHLVNISGLNPLEEFVRSIQASFDELMLEVYEEAQNTFRSNDFSSGDIDLDKAGIKAPSSTWTYQITDNPFSDDLGMLLASNRNIGFTPGILLLWPIVLFGIIYTRIKKSNKANEMV
ncbi:accessory Sec system translocase SecA2 [Pseudobacteroides cellulosolvens]|uniref:Protein translocase subunit SecA n=1 Tax=Pseudobacteroides cellulosolvens ATCC 35603 = DSM 2933 TaxID=398512 RepID=A0A0L6JN64_9FIRM|nr:accessory Sec system translocase SecA2 [Pseudobacteroides cellulosolvens]KNY27199.1 Protein translocase subunit secA [Pseudobacteroides cellulosolvens ATCC 35603 = DSM 2933]